MSEAQREVLEMRARQLAKPFQPADLLALVGDLAGRYASVS